MLIARLTDPRGFGSEEIAADAHDKDYYKALTRAGRVRCPDCDAEMVHVSGASDEQDSISGNFTVQAVAADGNPASRVPHWRSRAVEDHAAGCLWRDDPRDRRNVSTLTEALNEGKPVLVNINFDVGFEGLRNSFNDVAHFNEADLWSQESWKTSHPGYLPVPARDITDVLHYLQTAKALGGNKAMHKLFFHAGGAVQSAKRFVVSARGDRVREIIDAIAQRRTRQHRTNRQFYNDTPRLFLFEVSERQKRLAVDTRADRIFGQAYGYDGPHAFSAKTGLELHNSVLTNQSVVDRGTKLWIVGTPRLSTWDLNRLADIRAGRTPKDPGKPVFFMTVVEKRRALGVVGQERREPRSRMQNATPLPARQLEMDLPATSRRASAGKGRANSGTGGPLPR